MLVQNAPARVRRGLRGRPASWDRYCWAVGRLVDSAILESAATGGMLSGMTIFWPTQACSGGAEPAANSNR